MDDGDDDDAFLLSTARSAWPAAGLLPREERANELRARLSMEIINSSNTSFFPSHCGAWVTYDATHFAILRDEMRDADVLLADLLRSSNTYAFVTFFAAMMEGNRGETHQTESFLTAVGMYCDRHDDEDDCVKIYIYCGLCRDTLPCPMQWWLLLECLQERMFPVATALLHGSARHGIAPLSLEGVTRANTQHLLRKAMGGFLRTTFTREEIRANTDPEFWRTTLRANRTDEVLDFVLNELRHALPAEYIAAEDLFPPTNVVFEHLHTCLVAYLDCMHKRDEFDTRDFVAFICSTTLVEVW